MSDVVQVEPLGVPMLAATIAAGATGLSGAVDLGGYEFIGIAMPATWVTAAISFQMSDTLGGTYRDVYNDANTELTIASGAAVQGRMIVFGSAFKDTIRHARYLKLRSGVTATPVDQTATRVLQLLRKQGA